MKMKKRKRRLNWVRVGCAALLLPVVFVALSLVVLVLALNDDSGIQDSLKEAPGKLFEPKFPAENIPLYQEAADAYGIPWQLLAAHHRIETRFSTMDPMISPAGAEGHLQFMPCTFVGWRHPTCSGLGEGQMGEAEKTDPAVIEKYGGYGVDGDGDGIADPFNLTDALYSAAHYLSENGAADGNLERAIFNYNHSEKYVDDILHYYSVYEKEYP